jgi:xylulose-5-phosphate/fructose-6-phosphate phosphoketolase
VRNGGLLRRELRLPDFRAFAVPVASPGAIQAEATRIVGAFLRDVMRLNKANRNFRLVGSDETSSNRLDTVFEATDRVWMEALEPYDVHLSRDGRVMEVLSEHLCQGYLLTGNAATGAQSARMAESFRVRPKKFKNLVLLKPSS